MKSKRRIQICLYPADIMALTGKSYRGALDLMNKIRTVYEKPRRSLISIEEFCYYTGLNQEEVKDNL